MFSIFFLCVSLDSHQHASLSFGLLGHCQRLFVNFLGPVSFFLFSKGWLTYGTNRQDCPGLCSSRYRSLDSCPCHCAPAPALSLFFHAHKVHRHLDVSPGSTCVLCHQLLCKFYVFSPTHSPVRWTVFPGIRGICRKPPRTIILLHD